MAATMQSAGAAAPRFSQLDFIHTDLSNLHLAVVGLGRMGTGDCIMGEDVQMTRDELWAVFELVAFRLKDITDRVEALEVRS